MAPAIPFFFLGSAFLLSWGVRLFAVREDRFPLAIPVALALISALYGHDTSYPSSDPFFVGAQHDVLYLPAKSPYVIPSPHRAGDLRCAWGSSVSTTRFYSLGCCLTLIPPRSHSPYGTQMFFTWWAGSRYHRPSPCLSLKKSISRPSFVHTCFKFPTDSAFAVAHISSSP